MDEFTTDAQSGLVVGRVLSVADLVEQAVLRLEQARLGLAAYDGREAVDDGAAGAIVFRLMQARERLDTAIERLL